MSDFHVGQHVHADFGGGVPICIAHIATLEDDGKFGIQKPDGGVEQLGYREPEDRDEHGSGRTFWKV